MKRYFRRSRTGAKIIVEKRQSQTAQLAMSFLCVLAGAAVASVTSFAVARRTANAAYRERHEEDRHRAFARLVGVQEAFCAAHETALEVRLRLSVMGVVISVKAPGQAAVQRNREREWALRMESIETDKRMYDLQRELYEVAGEVGLAFNDDVKIQRLVRSLTGRQLVDIPPPPAIAVEAVGAPWQEKVREAYRTEINRKFRQPAREVANEMAERLGLFNPNDESPFRFDP